jgi:large subunit ribosomal protein L28e
MASADLVWELTKNRSAFLLKRKGLQLSTHPLNLTNKNSFSASGVANAEAIGMQLNKNGSIVVSRKNASHEARPKKMVSSFTTKSSTRSATKALIKSFGTYRPDLLQAAFRRYSALKKASKKQ